MKNLNSIVSKNLIKYRNLAGLTQKALAKKLNYSDKSISKWEKGERIPDFSVLVELSELYQIKVDDFLDNSTPEQEILISKRYINRKHILWCALSIGIVLLVASIVFFVLSMSKSTYEIAFYSFIYAIPVIGIVLLILSLLWWNTICNIIFTSLIDWGIILVFVITIKNIKPLPIIILGIALELIIVIFYHLLNKKREKK